MMEGGTPEFPLGIYGKEEKGWKKLLDKISCSENITIKYIYKLNNNLMGHYTLYI